MSLLQLPTESEIDAAAASLSVTASPAETRLLIKAQWALHKGVELVAVNGGVLVPSADGQKVYKVASDGSCTCPATRDCYHQWIVSILEEVHAKPTMPALIKRQMEETRLSLGERLAAARKATALVNELFA